MNPEEKIQKFVKGKVCGVIAPGSSIKELEERIVGFKDLPIVWVGMNIFEYIEEGILSKINKQFTIVSDCTTVSFKKDFEPHRVERFEKYLSRDNNLLVTSRLVIKECLQYRRPDLLEKYADKILAIDDSLKFEDAKTPAIVRGIPPNSITLLLGTLVCGLAKKIIMFGLDGRTEDNNTSIDSYYKREPIKASRTLAYGKYTNIGSLTSDSLSFEEKFPNLFNIYKTMFGNKNIEIVNCSPKSMFTIFRKISYNNVAEEVL